MGRPKGIIKTGGRQKGTPNKATETITEVLKKNNFDPISNIVNKYSALSVSEQLKVDLKLIEFLYPKPRFSEIPLQSEFDPVDAGNLVNQSDAEIHMQSEHIMTRLMIKKKGYAERVIQILKAVQPDLLRAALKD
jgi:hypothetical protein